ncbi:MAG: hypothetical protein IJ761_07930 [Bacteroidales bacterium]|nr:hypothetical protein [Bacteroidales bacterium]
MEPKASIILSLAGLRLEICGEHLSVGILHIEGFPVFVVSKSHVDKRVVEDSTLQGLSFHIDGGFPILNGALTTTFGRDEEGRICYSFGDLCWLAYNPQNPDEVRLSSCHDLYVMRFALWVATGLLGVTCGVVPVHSSVVVCQGRAVMCLGESGTGKSTHTKLWQETFDDVMLLNDDCPLVAVRGTDVWVYGSPWSGKTPCYVNAGYPLAAMGRIRQAKHNLIRRLSTIEAIAAVMPSCPPSLQKESQMLDEVASFVGGVVKNVPIYMLDCLPDADAAHVCRDVVFAQV